MNIYGHDNDGPGPVPPPIARLPGTKKGSRRARKIDQAWAESVLGTSDANQTESDANQTESDANQTESDADQTASAADQTSADRDQDASDQDQATADRDQATADRDRADHRDLTAAERKAYETSRQERDTGSFTRLETRLERSATAHSRDLTSTDRDLIAAAHDEASRSRDERADALAEATLQPDAPLVQQLQQLTAQAAADRARAAADRERAAFDRATAARERTRLEAELLTAHLDDLTGAYRRDVGRLALTHEIDRARRSDGRFVVAFVDVDRLKFINDRDGHAAGDRVLQVVVRAIRTRLRSFDPIIRYGGDEFICGLSGTDLPEAQRRFDSIGIAIKSDAQVGISVGLAQLTVGDTVDELTERADVAMFQVKAKHRVRYPQGS